MLKKIKTQAEIKRKQNQKKILIGVVLIFIMVISTIGYSLISSDKPADSKVTEKDLDFYKENNRWITQFDGRVFRFNYLPSEVSNVSVEGVYDLGAYVNQPINFVGENEGTFEIWTNLGSYALRYQPACLNDSICEGDFPVKNCESDLIVFKEGNDTRVYKENSCVFITGDYVKGADAFLYEVLKIN